MRDSSRFFLIGTERHENSWLLIKLASIRCSKLNKKEFRKSFSRLKESSLISGKYHLTCRHPYVYTWTHISGLCILKTIPYCIGLILYALNSTYACHIMQEWIIFFVIVGSKQITEKERETLSHKVENGCFEKFDTIRYNIFIRCLICIYWSSLPDHKKKKQQIMSIISHSFKHAHNHKSAHTYTHELFSKSIWFFVCLSSISRFTTFWYMIWSNAQQPRITIFWCYLALPLAIALFIQISSIGNSVICAHVCVLHVRVCVYYIYMKCVMNNALLLCEFCLLFFLREFQFC